MDTSGPALPKTHYWLPLSRPLTVRTLSYHPPNRPPVSSLGGPQALVSQAVGFISSILPSPSWKACDNSSALVGAHYV